MFEYKYVEAKAMSFLSESDYKEIISMHAKEGWRLVQVLPVEFKGYGVPKRYDIIFERKLED